MYIVSKDGKGDFISIQEAIDAVPDRAEEPFTLYIKKGIYHERVILNKDYVSLIGEDRDKTIITYSGCAKDLKPDGTERGTFLSFSMIVTGNDVKCENLTIRNDAGDGRIVGQAVAVYAAGDRGTWRNCRLIACQDTLFCGPMMKKVEDDIAPRISRAECVESVGDCPITKSRQYFENCYIQGDVDFIFGPYCCWFEKCTLFMNARGGFYTAANTPEGQNYGMIFHQCSLTGECEPGMAYLGRPWRKHAQTVFLHCDMDACVAPQGFHDWLPDRLVTHLYGEYGTTGERADLSLRHERQKRLSENEAESLKIKTVLSGTDNWYPQDR